MSQRQLYEPGCRLHGVLPRTFKIQSFRAQTAFPPRAQTAFPSYFIVPARIFGIPPARTLCAHRARTFRTRRSYFFGIPPRPHTYMFLTIACVPACTVTFSTPHHLASVPALSIQRARYLVKAQNALAAALRCWCGTSAVPTALLGGCTPSSLHAAPPLGGDTLMPSHSSLSAQCACEGTKCFSAAISWSRAALSAPYRRPSRTRASGNPTWLRASCPPPGVTGNRPSTAATRSRGGRVASASSLPTRATGAMIESLASLGLRGEGRCLAPSQPEFRRQNPLDQIGIVAEDRREQLQQASVRIGQDHLPATVN